jgi:hypothetical protein
MVAREALVFARREGNMRSMREAADAFLRAERDQTAHVVTAHRKVAEELATAEVGLGLGLGIGLGIGLGLG